MGEPLQYIMWILDKTVDSVFFQNWWFFFRVDGKQITMLTRWSHHKNNVKSRLKIVLTVFP